MIGKNLVTLGKLFSPAVGVFVASMMAANTAAAVPVVWTLTDVTFDDGATAAGSFMYDADLDQVIAWEILVDGGNTAVFPMFTYSSGIADHAMFVYNDFQTADICTPPGCDRTIRLAFEAPLTNAGGTVPLDFNFVYGENVECFNCGPFRRMITGSLVGEVAVVPIPAAGWLLGSAMVGLLGLRKRQS